MTNCQCPRCQRYHDDARPCPVDDDSLLGLIAAADRADVELPDPTRDRSGYAHRGAVDTEREAAQLIEPSSGTWRARVLAALRSVGDSGFTDAEIATETGGYLYTVAPRRKELVEMGWVCDSGRRRSTPRDRLAVVWILTDAARESGE